jgi:subtilisin family serine protease
MIHMCELSDGICVSATGPTSAASVTGPWTDVDAFGLYSGYGRAIVDVAAPGGQRFTSTRVWLPCTTTPAEFTPASCRVPGAAIEQRLGQGIGTSWAVPHVAGLAALLMARHGTGNPHRVRAAILSSADDLGEPGRDPYYGRGRINIARALNLARR